MYDLSDRFTNKNATLKEQVSRKPNVPTFAKFLYSGDLYLRYFPSSLVSFMLMHYSSYCKPGSLKDL